MTTEFKKFDATMKRVLSVSQDELQKRERNGNVNAPGKGGLNPPRQRTARS
jgi:hypothetical protein